MFTGYDPHAMAAALAKYYEVGDGKARSDALATLEELAAGQRRQIELLERLAAALEAPRPAPPSPGDPS